MNRWTVLILLSLGLVSCRSESVDSKNPKQIEKDAQVQPVVSPARFQEDVEVFLRRFPGISMMADAVEQFSFARGAGIVEAANDVVRLSKMRSNCLQAETEVNRVSLNYGPSRGLAGCYDVGIERKGLYQFSFLRNEPEGRLVELKWTEFGEPRGFLTGKAMWNEDRHRQQTKFEVTWTDTASSKQLYPISGEFEMPYAGAFELSGSVSYSDVPLTARLEDLKMQRGQAFPNEGSVLLTARGREIELSFRTDGALTMILAQYDGETLTYSSDAKGNLKGIDEAEKPGQER